MGALILTMRWLADGTFTPYSTIGNPARKAVQAAAYDLHFAIIDLQAVLEAAAGLPACAGEEEAEEECVHPQPVEALKAVRPRSPASPLTLHAHRLQSFLRKIAYGWCIEHSGTQHSKQHAGIQSSPGFV